MGQVHIGYEGIKNKALKTFQEVIREVPVYIEKIVEVPVEKIVYLDRHIEKKIEVSVPYEKPVYIEVEKIVNVYEQLPSIETIKTVEVIKEVPIYTEKYVDVPRDVIKEVIKYKIPNWVYPIMGLEGLAILLLLIIK